MSGNDNSLGGIIGALTLFVLIGLLSRVIFRFPRFARILEGAPTTLIENGVIVMPNLRREVMTIEELQRGLLKHGLDWNDVPRVHLAQLELDGTVTVHVKGAAA
jgi:uncharacterized membrane protein YcaP (DUF421 family)